LSFVEIGKIKKRQQAKEKIQKIIENKEIKNDADQGNKKPFKLSFPKGSGRQQNIGDDSKILYTEWNSTVKNSCLDAYNSITFNDELFLDKLKSSYDLNHAIQSWLGYPIESDYIGGFATLASITLDHGINNKLLKKPVCVPKSNAPKNDDDIYKN